MKIFDFPRRALSGAFPVFDRSGTEALLVVPDGSMALSDADWQYYPDAELRRLPVSMQTLVPEQLADDFPDNPVYVSSQLCGGRLDERLSDALDAYGERLWLLLEPVCALLPLPCPDGRETRITQAQSAMLRKTCDVFAAEAFCCAYCVELSAAPPQLHLFDTPDTVAQKLALAESLGIRRTLVLPIV